MLLWLMHGWYALMPGVVVFIAGTLTLGVWRVWFESGPRKKYIPKGLVTFEDLPRIGQIHAPTPSSSLPPHVGFVFEWIQKIYPELVKIAHVPGHDRQPVHDGRCGDHGVLH